MRKLLSHLATFAATTTVMAQTPAADDLAWSRQHQMGEKQNYNRWGYRSGSGRFPVQQALGALEVIEDYPVDTIRDNDKMRCSSNTASQFDSGHIPRFRKRQ
jgi:hypothetical protein